MSYLDRIHKKPVEYKVSDEVTVSESDEVRAAEAVEAMSIHDVPMGYFTKNEDGKYSIALDTQSRITPGTTHEFIIDPDKVDIVADNDRRSVDLCFKNLNKNESVIVNGKARVVSAESYVKDLRALVYKNRMLDKGSANTGRGYEMFNEPVSQPDDYDFS